MKLKNAISVGLLSFIVSLPFCDFKNTKKVMADELPYEIVECIDSTGEQLIDTGIKHGSYPRLSYDFALLEDSSTFIAGSESLRLYTEGNQFKLNSHGSTLAGNGFVPYKRFTVIVGRQETWAEDYQCLYLDLQESGLSFEHMSYSPNPTDKNITLFGGYIGEETIYSKVRLYGVNLNGTILKPCHILATDEYCLVNESNGQYYKDVSGKPFYRDTLVEDVTYINKEGNEATAKDANLIRLDNGVGRVQGNVLVKEDFELKTLELQADTNLYVCDDVTLTITEGIKEANNTNKFKLNIYGQTKQTGNLIVNGKNGGSRTGKGTEPAGNGTVAIKVKSLFVYGCHSSFNGGNGGNNNCNHDGMLGYNINMFKAGHGAFAAVCDEINILRGEVSFTGGKGGLPLNQSIIDEYAERSVELYGKDSHALNNEVVVNNSYYSFEGGESLESSQVLDYTSESYLNNSKFKYLKFDTFCNECPYDVIVIDEGVGCPFITFASYVESINEFSNTFVCYVEKDLNVDIELSLRSNEVIDLNGHTLTCAGLFLINNASIANSSENIGKVITPNFYWTKDGYGQYKSVKGYDGIYYIVSSNFAVVEKITYTWENDTCYAKAYHEGFSDIIETSNKGTYVKDTDAAYKEDEKGHYEVTFEAPFAKQETAKNSVTKEGTALTVKDHVSGEIKDKLGCQASISGSAVILFVIPLLVACLLKKRAQ